MAENIRPTYPPKPSNPAQSKGDVANVGAGPDPAVIRPDQVAKPSNPTAGQGAVPNVNR
jgi:hypothetical protein